MKKLLIIILLTGFSLNAQNPDYHRYGARTKFVQPDTLSTSLRNALIPKLGTLIYHKDTGISQWEQWNGSSWEELSGGSVDSVNGYTGAVVLDPDDLDDSATTNKFVTATQKGLIDTALQTETDPIFTAWDKDYNDLINTPLIPTQISADSVLVSNIGSFVSAQEVLAHLDSTVLRKVNISNEAYDASTWNGVDSIAPSKNAVRDKIASIDNTLSNVAIKTAVNSFSATNTFTNGLKINTSGGSQQMLDFTGNFTSLPAVYSSDVSLTRIDGNLAIKMRADATKSWAVFDGSLITDINKTFTFPNKSGTIALLDDISGGGSNEAADITVDTSEFTNNLTVADSTVQKALKTLDDLSIGVNTAFRTVSSTSGVFAESYDTDQPNFQLTLDEDVEIEITDAVNGDFLIAEIVNPEDEPFLVTFIGSDKEYLIEGGETAVFSMVTNADDETIWIKSILEDTASLYKEISETGAVPIDFKNYDFIKLNVEDENYLEFINPRKNVANLTLHLENKEGVPYDIHFPENTLFKTLGQGATIELGSDQLGVFKFDYRDGGFICTSYEVEYDIPVVHTYTIVRRVNTGSISDITATDGFINWQNGFGGGAGGPLNNLQVTTGNNLATTSVTWTRHGSIPSSLPDTDFQTLFDSERWDESGGSEMKYTFSSMTAGTYKVRIYMGESNGSATVGTRVFDIKIQGSTVESNVDMVAKFGGNQIAGMVEYDNIIVSGTTLDVEWIHVTENPVVNGIEILKRD